MCLLQSASCRGVADGSLGRCSKRSASILPVRADSITQPCGVLVAISELPWGCQWVALGGRCCVPTSARFGGGRGIRPMTGSRCLRMELSAHSAEHRAARSAGSLSEHRAVRAGSSDSGLSPPVVQPLSLWVFGGALCSPCRVLQGATHQAAPLCCCTDGLRRAVRYLPRAAQVAGAAEALRRRQGAGALAHHRLRRACPVCRAVPQFARIGLGEHSQIVSLLPWSTSDCGRRVIDGATWQRLRLLIAGSVPMCTHAESSRRRSECCGYQSV